MGPNQSLEARGLVKSLIVTVSFTNLHRLPNGIIHADSEGCRHTATRLAFGRERPQ